MLKKSNRPYSANWRIRYTVRHSKCTHNLTWPMTFVVLEDCIKCKYTDCVEVCPVECFHEGPNFLVIDPEECIDCALCVPECPIDAIVPEKDVPEDQQEFLQINADLAGEWPEISRQKPPPPDADEWRGKSGKKTLLEL